MRPPSGSGSADQLALDLVDAAPEELAERLHEAGIVEQAVGFIGGDDLHGVSLDSGGDFWRGPGASAIGGLARKGVEAPVSPP